MNTRIEKFKTGIKKDPLRTISRAIKYTLQDLFVIIGYRTCRALIMHLPTQQQALIKDSLHPIVRMDYDRYEINICADSIHLIKRARAYQKEPDTVRWIEEFVDAGEIFYDIGANVGAYSLIASKYFLGNLKIYAFEPSFSNYDQLCRNVILNDCKDSIFPYLIALNDRSGPVIFNYKMLDAGGAYHKLGDIQNGNPGGFVPAYQQRLLGFSIDYLVSSFGFPAPNHIKLDVDGAEVVVLEGAAETLKGNFVKSILVEVRESDGTGAKVLNQLSLAGFDLVSEINLRNKGIWNYIFKKRP